MKKILTSLLLTTMLVPNCSTSIMAAESQTLQVLDIKRTYTHYESQNLGRDFSTQNSLDAKGTFQGETLDDGSLLYFYYSGFCAFPCTTELSKKYWDSSSEKFSVDPGPDNEPLHEYHYEQLTFSEPVICTLYAYYMPDYDPNGWVIEQPTASNPNPWAATSDKGTSTFQDWIDAGRPLDQDPSKTRDYSFANTIMSPTEGQSGKVWDIRTQHYDTSDLYVIIKATPAKDLYDIQVDKLHVGDNTEFTISGHYSEMGSTDFTCTLLQKDKRIKQFAEFKQQFYKAYDADYTLEGEYELTDKPFYYSYEVQSSWYSKICEEGVSEFPYPDEWLYKISIPKYTYYLNPKGGVIDPEETAASLYESLKDLSLKDAENLGTLCKVYKLIDCSEDTCNYIDTFIATYFQLLTDDIFVSNGSGYTSATSCRLEFDVSPSTEKIISFSVPADLNLMQYSYSSEDSANVTYEVKLDITSKVNDTEWNIKPVVIEHYLAKVTIDNPYYEGGDGDDDDDGDYNNPDEGENGGDGDEDGENSGSGSGSGDGDITEEPDDGDDETGGGNNDGDDEGDDNDGDDEGSSAPGGNEDYASLTALRHSSVVYTTNASPLVYLSNIDSSTEIDYSLRVDRNGYILDYDLYLELGAKAYFDPNRTSNGYYYCKIPVTRETSSGTVHLILEASAKPSGLQCNIGDDTFLLQLTESCNPSLTINSSELSLSTTTPLIASYIVNGLPAYTKTFDFSYCNTLQQTLDALKLNSSQKPITCILDAGKLQFSDNESNQKLVNEIVELAKAQKSGVYVINAGDSILKNLAKQLE